LKCFSSADENPKSEKILKETQYPDWVKEADKGKPLEPRQFKDVSPRTKPPIIKRGEIRVYKMPPRGTKGGYPTPSGYTSIIPCKNRSCYHTLSPMLLKPVYIRNSENEWEKYGETIEDCWQCSKVFPAHLCGKDHEKSNKWKTNWMEWSRRGRFSLQSRRHRVPKGKWVKQQKQFTNKNKNIPLFCYFKGEKLKYKDARLKMYMPWYEQLIQHENAFKDLYHRHLSGENFVLYDHDGLEPKENDEALTKKRLIQLINNDSRPFGHGLVLACCLLDLPLWRMDETYEKEIIDFDPIPLDFVKK